MLNNAQLQLMRADLALHPELTTTSDIVDYYNALESPAFIVWRTKVTLEEITQNGFNWTRVDNLSIGKARIWEWMFANPDRSINPAKTNVRAGVDATWVGTQADLDVRAAVYVHCKRSATRAEKVCATGAGSDASPAVSDFEGLIDLDDASLMR